LPGVFEHEHREKQGQVLPEAAVPVTVFRLLS
jgi:hypothetical protein